MRKLAFIVVSLLLLGCGREPVAPSAPMSANVVFQVPTGGYDIYVYDVRTGDATQVTTLAGALEFNPSFSPDGRSIVHDVVHFDPFFFQDLYITDVVTGVSRPLLGGEGGNDGDWSPTGLIAFDRFGSLYVVPASGGTSRLVRATGNDPQWNPAGNALVFVDVDNSIRTIELRSGTEHVVAPFGFHPAWSIDGRRIVYSDNFNLFLVDVTQAGAALGPPRQLTFDFGAVFNQQPTWSNDGKTIVFHSNRGNEVFDFDVWSVSISGGAPSLVTGTVGQGDFDPAFYQRKLVAFAGFTPGF